MSRLKKELGIAQGAGLMSTSLLGAGVFVVPALAASIAGYWSLLAWALLIVLALPIALTFALLGRKYPHAGGTPHMVGQAMGLRLEKMTAFLYLAVLPVAVPAGLELAAGFWLSVFELNSWLILAVKLGTLLAVLLLGLGGARCSGNVQLWIALCISLLIISLWWAGGIHLTDALMPESEERAYQTIMPALAVMFWCFVGIEAFTHMGEEFKHPQRDFPLALLFGVLVAGLIYWGCATAVVKFGFYGTQLENARSIPALTEYLLGSQTQWVAAAVGYMACFASINTYLQGFSRLLWSMAEEGSLDQIRLQSLSVLSDRQLPIRALWTVIVASALSAIIAHFSSMTLESLICFSNGNLIVIYFLCMLAGLKLLTGWQRAVAFASAILCLLVLVALGSNMLYVFALVAGFLIFERLCPSTYCTKEK